MKAAEALGAIHPNIPALDHEEAMQLAECEYGRLLDVVDRLQASDWQRPTDCVGWDVKATLAHVLGMMKRDADKEENARQFRIATQVAQETGGLRLDALTALHVREHAHLTPGEVAAGLRAFAGPALAGRRATTAQERATPYPTGLPGEGQWTRGYLLDIVLTRDVWMHRIDVCRAIGRPPALSDDHDARIVADVVADWARRHGEAFTLILDGVAGGAFSRGRGGPTIRIDAVEFCRVLSGRGSGDGLLVVRVPF